MFEHVLAAIDFSYAWPPIKARLAYLQTLGTRKVSLVYVMSSRYPTAPELTHHAHYSQRLDEEAQALGELGLEAHTRILVGEPGRELAWAAREVAADLLLMGSRGQGKVKQFLIGSTALDAARLTTGPLWLEPIGEDVVEHHDTILLATDGSDAVTAAESWMEKLAPRYRQAIAISVTGPPDSPERAMADQHLGQLIRRIPGLEVRLEQGDPREVVVSLARELPADLTIVGKRGRSAVKELLLGSTAEAVCRQARRPVLLVPAD